jgi:hypothetical protein
MKTFHLTSYIPSISFDSQGEWILLVEHDLMKN